ncbi:MAG: site-specific DNA-methyltransferase, partial [Lachnospiraceae bacterium]|nr:site-specific DNA-methyltransferase [Lachnospiraceae bacterium]
MELNRVYCNDAEIELQKIEENIIDLIYLYPPFFTNNIQKLVSKDEKKEYFFSDKWKDMNEYLSYIESRL